MARDGDEVGGAQPNEFGRGMLSVSLDESGTVRLEHKVDHQTFSFDVSDLDEVVGVLNMFRMTVEACQEDDDENGEA